MSTPQHPQLCLLVVDDEREVVDSVYHLLRRTYRLLRATSAAEAVELMTEHEVDIIMTDQRMPEVAGVLLSRMGNASIALGLILVGAGLRLSGVKEGRAMSAYFIAVKLLAMPALALFIGHWLALPWLQLQILVMFGALPTASSAYVLAARLGGNAPLVAFIISAGTLVSIATLPFWLFLSR